MRSRLSPVRAGALLTSAALALHELRYLIAYGHHSQRALTEQGHAYLGFVHVLAGALLALAAGALLTRVVRAGRTGVGEASPPRFAVLWLGASLALVAIYSGQELLEGLLASGHPAGLAALTAQGGLVVLPLATLLGGAVALGLRGAAALVTAMARRRARRGRARSAFVPAAPRAVLPQSQASVLARHLAGRAPPLLA
jgi:hypothetical protein